MRRPLFDRGEMAPEFDQPRWSAQISVGCSEGLAQASVRLGGSVRQGPLPAGASRPTFSPLDAGFVVPDRPLTTAQIRSLRCLTSPNPSPQQR